jgi:hypothetical protein
VNHVWVAYERNDGTYGTYRKLQSAMEDLQYLHNRERGFQGLPPVKLTYYREGIDLIARETEGFRDVVITRCPLLDSYVRDEHGNMVKKVR